VSVYKRGGTWWFNFWFEGQHVQRPTKVKSRTQALKMQAIHKSQLALGKYGLGSKKEIPKFSTFAERYLEYSKANKPAYVVERYLIPKTLVPFFSRFLLSEITPFVLEKYKQKRLADKVKKASINREIGLLKSMLSSAVKWQLIDSNPARDGKLFKLDELPSTRVLSHEEEEKLLAACDDPELKLRAPHLKTFIMAAIYTGLRRGELLRTRFAEDLDFENNVLTVRKSKTKAGRGRQIPLNSLLRKQLLKWKEESPGPWVFPSPSNPREHLRDIKHSFQRAVKLSGIAHLTMHQLRHTFCSRLSDAGVPLAVIQELAGHASPVVTRRYMHPANELKIKAVELLLKAKKEAVPTTKPTTPKHRPKRMRTTRELYPAERKRVIIATARPLLSATAT
jgi:integrase